MDQLMHTMLNLHCSTLFPNIQVTQLPNVKPNSHLSPKDPKNTLHIKLFFFEIYKGFSSTSKQSQLLTTLLAPFSLFIYIYIFISIIFFFFIIFYFYFFCMGAKTFHKSSQKFLYLSHKDQSIKHKSSLFSFELFMLPNHNHNTHPHLQRDNRVPNLARMKIKHCRSRYSQHYAHVRLSEKGLTH